MGEKLTKKKQNKIKSNQNVHKKVYYSFLTIVLLICLVQISISAFLNISKCIINHAKINKMKQYKEELLVKNSSLKNEAKNFSSLRSLEAIARNNLKMAGQDEVLVILNQPEKKKVEEKKHLLFDKELKQKKKKKESEKE